MKILIAPSHVHFDGSGKGSEVGWAFDLVHRLATRHPESVVVTGRALALPPHDYRVVQVDPQSARVDVGPRAAVAFTVKCALAGRRLLAAETFDVAHHVLPYALGSTLHPQMRRHGLPLVIGPVQNPLTVLEPDETSRAARLLHATVGAPLARLSRRHLQAAAAVVAIHPTAAGLVRAAGVSINHLTVVPPGIDTARWTAARRESPRGGALHLVAATTFTERKAAHVLLHALRRVKPHHPHLRLTLAGNGPQLPALRVLAAQLGVADMVTFTGRIERSALANLFHGADLLVSTSRAESFASVCLEALASGLPVVATAVGGFADAVRDGVEGHLIPLDDAEALAAVLTRLAADPLPLAGMRAAARRRAEKTYDWDRVIVPAYEAVLEAAASGTSRRT